MHRQQRKQVATLQTQLRAGFVNRVLSTAFAVVALSACAAAGAGSPTGDTAADITRVLVESADEWNAGNLTGFLEPYLDSPSTTYVGSTGITRGKAAIEAAYRTSYWRDGPPAQKLRFVGIEVRPLGEIHALAVGRYQLYQGTNPPSAEGIFSLVLTLTSDGWRIIHDHSS